VTPEGKIKKKVTAVLKKHGCYYFMPVQTGFGKKTLDYLICHGGYFFAVETKAPGKSPTALQQATIREIKAAGGTSFVIDSEEGANLLDRFLEKISGDTSIQSRKAA
jgi:hypothetical protein